MTTGARKYSTNATNLHSADHHGPDSGISFNEKKKKEQRHCLTVAFLLLFRMDKHNCVNDITTSLTERLSAGTGWLRYRLQRTVAASC